MHGLGEKQAVFEPERSSFRSRRRLSYALAALAVVAALAADAVSIADRHHPGPELSPAGDRSPHRVESDSAAPGHVFRGLR